MKFHSLLTVQLLAGLIDHVINNTGAVTPGPVAAPSFVVDFPAGASSTPTVPTPTPGRQPARTRRPHAVTPTPTTQRPPPARPRTDHHHDQPTTTTTTTPPPLRQAPPPPTTSTPTAAGDRCADQSEGHLDQQQRDADLVRCEQRNLRHPAGRGRGEDRHRAGQHLHRQRAQCQHAVCLFGAQFQGHHTAAHRHPGQRTGNDNRADNDRQHHPIDHQHSTTVTGTPSNLHKTGQTASTITIGWTGPAGASYDILRGEAGDKIATVTGNSFTDMGLLAEYPVCVFRQRGRGNHGADHPHHQLIGITRLTPLAGAPICGAPASSRLPMKNAFGCTVMTGISHTPQRPWRSR